MGFELSEALRRLYVEIGWSYAVFWRAVGFPVPKHLVWDNGHWIGKLQFSMSGHVNSHANSLAEFESVGNGSIDELVKKTMVPQVHVIGVGIVGQAASTGNHRWIVRNVTGDNESTLKHFPDVNNQFLVGIQTIVIIPVFPHGVVQFGSTKRVMENLLFVNHARTSFMQLALEPGSSIDFGQNNFPCPSISSETSDFLFRDNCSNVDRSLSMRCNHQLSISSASRSLSHSSSLSTPIKENLSKTDPEGRSNKRNVGAAALPFTELHQPAIRQVGNAVFRLSNQLENELVAAQVASNEDLMSLSKCGSRTQESAIAIKASIDGVFGDFDTDSQFQKIEPIDSAKDRERLATVCTSEIVLNHSNVSCAYHPGIIRDINSLNRNHSINSHANNLSKKSHGVLIPDHLKQWNRLHSSGISSSSFCHGDDSCKVGKLPKISAEDDSSFIFMPNEKSSSSSQLATSGDDLFDVLALYDSLDTGRASKQQSTAAVPACSAQLNLSPMLYSVEDAISCAEVFSESNTDQLLDAVVSSVCQDSRQSLDVAPFGKASGAKVSGSSTPCPSIDETERPVYNQSQTSLWAESGKNMNGDMLFASNGKRVDEISKLNRKRVRSGETPRPRPKDRQLIMDRVKELREIVPNGAKCSIDALLEKTIKHMLFLQSVSEHADKLRKTGEPKIVSKDGAVVLKDNFRGGATWAFEVGSQTMACPIIVEDLNPPRELLVEMLCEERGLFLEIADLIRGLGLTILKGIMEARRDKIWARFAVEAKRDVTRMEIFLSLVHLLEPAIGSGITPHSVHNSKKLQKIFDLPRVPATGASEPLQ